MSLPEMLAPDIMEQYNPETQIKINKPLVIHPTPKPNERIHSSTFDNHEFHIPGYNNNLSDSLNKQALRLRTIFEKNKIGLVLINISERDQGKGECEVAMDGVANMLSVYYGGGEPMDAKNLQETLLKKINWLNNALSDEGKNTENVIDFNLATISPAGILEAITTGEQCVVVIREDGTIDQTSPANKEQPSYLSTKVAKGDRVVLCHKNSLAAVMQATTDEELTQAINSEDSPHSLIKVEVSDQELKAEPTAEPEVGTKFDYKYLNPTELNEQIDSEQVKNLLSQDNFDPQQLQDLLSANPYLRDLYASSAHVTEGYTIGQHTVMGGNQFEKYFKNKPLPIINGQPLGKEFFRLMYALHDLGKPISVAETGNKYQQKKYGPEIAREIMTWMKVPQDQVDLASIIIAQDWIGEAILNTYSILDQSNYQTQIEDIKLQAKSLGIPAKELFKVAQIYYMTDASAYTLDAGGLQSLDYLFDFKPAEGEINLRPRYDAIVNSISSGLEDHRSEQKELPGINEHNFLVSPAIKELLNQYKSDLAHKTILGVGIFLGTLAESPEDAATILDIMKQIDFRQYDNENKYKDVLIRQAIFALKLDVAVQFTQKKLGRKFFASTQDALAIAEYLSAKGIYKYYHGTNTASLDSILTHGLHKTIRQYEVDDIEQLSTISRRLNASTNDFVGYYDINARGKLFATTFPELAIDYAKRSPEWFFLFTNNKSDHPLPDRDYNRAKANVEAKIKRFQTSNGSNPMTEQEADIVRGIFERSWAILASSDQAVVLNFNPENPEKILETLVWVMMMDKAEEQKKLTDNKPLSNEEKAEINNTMDRMSPDDLRRYVIENAQPGLIWNNLLTIVHSHADHVDLRVNNVEPEKINYTLIPVGPSTK